MTAQGEVIKLWYSVSTSTTSGNVWLELNQVSPCKICYNRKIIVACLNWLLDVFGVVNLLSRHLIARNYPFLLDGFIAFLISIKIPRAYARSTSTST